jgi:hypothetical protein
LVKFQQFRLDTFSYSLNSLTTFAIHVTVFRTDNILLSSGGTRMIALDHSKKRIIKLAVVGIAILGLILFLRQCSLDPTSGFDMRYGFCESSFKLAKESRLPKWIQVPSGLERADVTVQFLYFLSITKVAARNNKTGELFFSAEAKMEPYPWKGSCPSFNEITINGMNEVVAHIERGNIVYIAEQDEIKRGYYENTEIKKRCETLKYFE